MPFFSGLTVFRINEPVKVKNESTPGFDEYVLLGSCGGYETIIKQDFNPDDEHTYSYSNEGIRQLKLRATQTVQGIEFILEKSVTFDVGIDPDFSLYFQQSGDQSPSYTDNYVIAGETFSFEVLETTIASSPKIYTWNYGGAVTFSSATASPQEILFNSFGNKFVGLTITNRFGTGSSQIMFKPINTPLIGITGTPTFGVVLQNTEINLSKSFLQTNGHYSSDVDYTWIVSGQSFTGPNLNYTLGSTGVIGITLSYQSKIFTNLTGSTYAEYLVIEPLQQIPLYYDPGLLTAFYTATGFPDATSFAAQIAYYRNEMKKYGTEYKEINNSAFIGQGRTWDANTAPGQIERYLYFRDNYGATGAVMINCEYPWLNLLGANTLNAGQDAALKGLTAVREEAMRQGVTLTGMTLGGYRKLAVNCWRDINSGLSALGCPHWIHYASSKVAFNSYYGVPKGMIQFGPEQGISASHFYYLEHPDISNAAYGLRTEFNYILDPAHFQGQSLNAFNDTMRAQSNAPLHGPAAYCFIPNSAMGFCGAPYWRTRSAYPSSPFMRLYGFSGGVTFMNGGTVSPIDYTEESLRDGVRVTSAKMWLEYVRACQMTIDMNLCEPEHALQKYAPIVYPTIEPLYDPNSSDGGFWSRSKWYLPGIKDPERTAEDEVAAIFKDNYRVNYSNYSVIKKPDEIWVWDNLPFFHINPIIRPIRSLDTRPTWTPAELNTFTFYAMVRNAYEREFFGRTQIPPGSSLWHSPDNAVHREYYLANFLPDLYWLNQNTSWWGLTGGTYANLLPSPCNFSRDSPLAPWLNFNSDIKKDDIIYAIKNRLTQNSVDFLRHSREKLDVGVCCKSYFYDKVSAGSKYVVAVSNKGQVRIFGDDLYGILNPSTFYGYTAISAGPEHVLAMKNDGSVVSWGRNQYGQASVPSGLTGVSQVSAGKYHSLALKSDGGVTCWGWNGFYQCDVPVGLTAVTQISTGLGHNLARKSDGTVSSWGYNFDGQTDVPVGLINVSKVSAGYHHSVALRQDGTIVAWGMNSYGQCTVPAGLTGIDIAAGGYHTLVLLSNKQIVAFGRNDHGQCNIPAGLTTNSISAGEFSSFAINYSGDIIGWGKTLTNQQTINDNTCERFDKPTCNSNFGTFYLTKDCFICSKVT